MTDKKIHISIIMPVFNSEPYLRTCVESILAQNFEGFELLLIDDGSTDGSPLICDEFAAKDSRVKAFHKSNGGISEARNFGIARAIGEYIGFSDHDDLVLPGFLTDNYKIVAQTGADIVKFGREELLIRDKKVLSSNTRKFADKLQLHGQIVDDFLMLRLRGAMECVWDGFFKRSFLLQNDLYFDTRYKKGGEDIDFCSRCFTLANKIAFRSAVYYRHYIRQGISTSTKVDENRLMKFKWLGDNLCACLEQMGAEAYKQKPAYLVCVAKEEMYPSLKFLISNKEEKPKIYETLDHIMESRGPGTFSYLEISAISRKWGILAWLYEHRAYGPLCIILRMRIRKAM